MLGSADTGLFQPASGALATAAGGAELLRATAGGAVTLGAAPGGHALEVATPPAGANRLLLTGGGTGSAVALQAQGAMPMSTAASAPRAAELARRPGRTASVAGNAAAVVNWLGSGAGWPARRRRVSTRSAMIAGRPAVTLVTKGGIGRVRGGDAGRHRVATGPRSPPLPMSAGAGPAAAAAVASAPPTARYAAAPGGLRRRRPRGPVASARRAARYLRGSVGGLATVRRRPGRLGRQQPAGPHGSRAGDGRRLAGGRQRHPYGAVIGQHALATPPAPVAAGQMQRTARHRRRQCPRQPMPRTGRVPQRRDAGGERDAGDDRRRRRQYRLAAAATVAGGNSNVASGSVPPSWAAGSNTATGLNSWVPGGERASTRKCRRGAWAAGRFASNGDAQAGEFVLRRQTTDATAATLTADGGAANTANRQPAGQRELLARLMVAARQTGGAAGTAGDSAGWSATSWSRAAPGRRHRPSAHRAARHARRGGHRRRHRLRAQLDRHRGRGLADRRLGRHQQWRHRRQP